MERLRWTAQDLYRATGHYGDVGSLHDVEEHLRTGDHLPREKRSYIAAALWDAELDATELRAPTGPAAPDVIAPPRRSAWQRARRRLWRRTT